jgi:hypothetical protein
LAQVAQTQSQMSEAPEISGTVASFAQYVLTDQGRVGFLANLKTAAGGVTGSNNQGVWVVDASGQSHPIAGKGLPLTTTSGTTSEVTALSIFAAPTGVRGQTRSFNAQGELLFAATFADGSQGIFSVSPDDAISPVRGTANAIPLAPGAGFVAFTTFNSPIINASGNAAFQATGLINHSVIPSDNGATFLSGIPLTPIPGIWAESGTARTLGQVASLGSASYIQATGTTIVTGTFIALGDPVFNANDQVGFIGSFKPGSAANAAIRQGIWVSGTSLPGLSLVAKANDPAPDCGTGAAFGSFAQLVLPDQGGAVFLANLATTTAGVTAATSQGVWAINTAGQLRLVARNGGILTDGNGDKKTIASLSIFTASTATAGQTRYFNNAGDLIYKVTFTDETEGIYKVVFP